MSDAWVPESVEGLIEDIARLMVRLADPSRAALGLEGDDGTSYDHEVLVDTGRRAGLLVSRHLRAGAVDDDSLPEFVSAVSELTVVALAVALADADAGEEDDGVALFDRFSRFLAEAIAALERTVVKVGDDRYRMRWTESDREMIRNLSAELDTLLDTDDASLVRLFPPAYGIDEDRSREYAALARDELVASRRGALAVVAGALEQSELSGDELHSLMRAINDLRLMLGTRLDVSEDDPRRP